MSQAQRFTNLLASIERTAGDFDKPFYYLSGPITGLTKGNIPEFERVAEVLRNNTYNIVSPVEMDDPTKFQETLEGKEMSKPEWLSGLSEHITVIAMPTCIGGIFLKHWRKSVGSNIEANLMWDLHKPVYEFGEGTLGLPALTEVPKRQTINLEVEIPRPQNAGAIMEQPLAKDSDFVTQYIQDSKRRRAETER